MAFMKTSVLRLLFFSVALTMLAGCSQFSLPTKKDFTANWVSKNGKTQEQFYEDQKACSRDARMATAPAFPGEMAPSGADMKAFDRCMRAKGWEKE